MVRPWWTTPDPTTSMVLTSNPGSMICTDAITGLGTAIMSVWQPSGEAMANGATMIPPAAVRMSRRIATVSSRSPTFMLSWFRPM